MEVFFYGLFMDIDVLRSQGTHPKNPKLACLQDYVLRIGERASLLPSPGDEAFGLVMTMEESELKKLYSEASVADYIAEQVTLQLENNKELSAWCYNLPSNLLKGTNESYAKSLYALGQSLNLPQHYLYYILSMAN